ncbi:MAG: dTDP-4-dehydrorhamnose 3,5-epimerase [Candidatus Kapaibacterium sp.]
MSLTIHSTHLDGIVVLSPRIFRDARGMFLESYHEKVFADLGLPTEFVQDNHSRSSKGVLRGMHFQWSEPMGKLLRVTRGAIELVELDIRVDSPTYGQHVTIPVDDVDNRIVWIPPGFANGFLVLSEVADVLYKCTALYNPQAEGSVRWDSFGKEWPTASPVLSDKDAAAMSLQEWSERPEARLFKMVM